MAMQVNSTQRGSPIMTVIITFVQDEDGMYIAECPSIPGCVSQGPTRDEAEANIRNAIRECLAVRREQGLPPTIQVEVRQLEMPV
jgi:predicted RNase H-like HicB family nuclease